MVVKELSKRGKIGVLIPVAYSQLQAPTSLDVIVMMSIVDVNDQLSGVRVCACLAV
jgi:hypothetical protein